MVAIVLIVYVFINFIDLFSSREGKNAFLFLKDGFWGCRSHRFSGSDDDDVDVYYDDDDDDDDIGLTGRKV